MLGNMSVLCAIVRNETLCVICDTKSESMPLTERRAKPRQSQEIGPRFDFTATYSRSTIRLATDRTRRQAHASPMHKWLGNVDLPEPHGTEWRRVMREERVANTCAACGGQSVVVPTLLSCYAIQNQVSERVRSSSSRTHIPLTV